ncbi:GntR family transcriptional regulator [Roseibium aggregatum]|uniref:GntR family transcriptional regulator n=1 Tax=Roseibium aggregatum TaxID=187304 RepID=UPI0025AD2709|nr:GntR family transcriptional regulator [Roseibium aggregatum]WJS05647.1 GntR family transcriptional regulator [Roseibium aggregatum]
MIETSNTSLAEQAYVALRNAILDNTLAPGSFASEREVCERFGLSRTPVHQALLRLRDEGLVDVQPRRGVRVLPLSIKDVREIHQVARALELEAALLLCEQNGGDAISILRSHVADMKAAIAADDRDAWVEADTKFHLGMVASSRNERLIQQYNGLRVLTDRARLFVLHIRALPVQSTDEHVDMLDAIEAGRLDLVATIYRTHWERTTNEMIEIIERFNRHRSGSIAAAEILVP